MQVIGEKLPFASKISLLIVNRPCQVFVPLAAIQKSFRCSMLRHGLHRQRHPDFVLAFKRIRELAIWVVLEEDAAIGVSIRSIAPVQLVAPDKRQAAFNPSGSVACGMGCPLLVLSPINRGSFVDLGRNWRRKTSFRLPLPLAFLNSLRTYS